MGYTKETIWVVWGQTNADSPLLFSVFPGATGLFFIFIFFLFSFFLLLHFYLVVIHFFHNFRKICLLVYFFFQLFWGHRVCKFSSVSNFVANFHQLEVKMAQILPLVPLGMGGLVIWSLPRRSSMGGGASPFLASC